MEGFSYTDIFATKGIEYLVVIAFLLMLIPFTLFLNKRVTFARKIREVAGGITAGIRKVPQGLLFNRNHTWLFMEKSGTARLGLDNLLLHMTGPVRFTLQRSPGESLRRGDLLAVIEQDGKRLNVLSPVSGTLVSGNDLLQDSPALINDDPYGSGWLCTIRPANWLNEVRSCFVAEEATAWLTREVARFRDFLSSTIENRLTINTMSVLQDGGEPADHCLERLPESVWTDFQKEFLEL